MVEIAHLLDDLSCAACGTSNALWLYPVRGVVECRECGEKAIVLVEPLDGDR
jgi:DNA-directed RNA polymerase subunit RPC12/RpoP